MFRGDITGEVSTIKDDIILIKQNLGLPVVKTISIESILSYIAIGFCILVLIILIILLIRIHRFNKRLESLEERLPLQDTSYPPYYPPRQPQQFSPRQQFAPQQFSPRQQFSPPPQQFAPPPQQFAPPQQFSSEQRVESYEAPVSPKQFAGYYYY